MGIAERCAGWELIGGADFTNVLKKSQIERLAEADEHELVREVQVRSSTTLFQKAILMV